MANRADRNNNPGNIKVPSGGLEQAKQMYGDSGLSIDPAPATDGGSFLKFSSSDLGQKAQTTLLKNPSYQSLSVDKAMRRWSGNGYGGDVAPSLASRNMSDLSPDELNTLATSMSKREGYTGNKLLGSETTGSPAQPIQDNTQPKKSMLTRAQIIQGINSMEQQGASQQEVQGYIDEHNPKKTTSDTATPETSSVGTNPDGSQKVQDYKPQFQNVGSGSAVDPHTGTFGENPNDSVYGKIIDNSITRGAGSVANALTFGGGNIFADQLGDSFAGLYEKTKGLMGGQDNSKYVPQADPISTAKGAAGIMAGGGSIIYGGGKIQGLLDSVSMPAVQKIVTPLLKKGLSLAKGYALTKLLGDTIGGFIHKTTGN